MRTNAKEFSDIVAKFIIDNTTPDVPLTGKAVGEYFNVSDVDIRKCVNKARQKGIPICSSGKGYYYSRNYEDIQKTIESIQGRINSQELAICGLNKFLYSQANDESLRF